MKITLDKNAEGKYEIKMVGTLQECNVVVEALENSITDNKALNSTTIFLRKKLAEHAQRG